MRKRDFFVYPKYNRKDGYKIHNFNDYVEHVMGMGLYFQGDFVTDLLNSKKRSKCDIYTRIFIDKSHSENFIAYILGYTLKNKFFENPKIINMPGGKSGRAIYYAYPISKSNSIDELLIDKNLW